MTIEEQRQQFLSRVPSEFMQFCFDQYNKGQIELPVCHFVKIRCREEIGLKLTNDELIFKEKYKEYFQDFNISGCIPSSYQNKLTIKSGHSWIKEIVSNVRTDFIRSNENNGKNISGIAELLKALYENLEFAKNNISTKGPTYNHEKLWQLLDGISTFTVKNYELHNSIIIKLSSKAFTHILIGHVSKYKIPRKGYQVLFQKVHNWKDLLVLIDQAIKLIETEIIEHFSKIKREFNKTAILINGNEYSIHIDKQGNIKTFYENVSQSK